MSWDFDGVRHRQYLRDSPFHKAVYDQLQTISKAAGIAAQRITQVDGGAAVARNLAEVETAYVEIVRLFKRAQAAKNGEPK